MSGKKLGLPKLTEAIKPDAAAPDKPASRYNLRGGRKSRVVGSTALPIAKPPAPPQVAVPVPATPRARPAPPRPSAVSATVKRRDPASGTERRRPRSTAAKNPSAVASRSYSSGPPSPPTAIKDHAGMVRVSKLMSEQGLCSRREADAFIERGWVLLDGVKVTELGTRASPEQKVTLSRDAQREQLQSVTILLNKPIGFVSGQPEPGYTPAVTLILPDNRWAEDLEPLRFNGAHLRGLAPAGRLDIDSTGLIVFTQDGRVARHLIGEDSNVEKEYLVRVEGEIIEHGLKRLNHGLSLDGKALKPAKVSWQNEDQLRFVLREGKKRQIRRMCELVGLNVVGLKRIRIGSVLLGKLPLGQWRYLREGEKF